MEFTPKQALTTQLAGLTEQEVATVFFGSRYVKYLLDKPVGYDLAVDEAMMKDGFWYSRQIMIDGEVKWCALMRMAFTVGLAVGITNTPMYDYEARYCFKSLKEAAESLQTWDGTHFPPGDWIKRKGKDGELTNPTIEDHNS